LKLASKCFVLRASTLRLYGKKMSYYFERTSTALVSSHLYSKKNEAIYFILASPLFSDFFSYRPLG
jgi:hypothetical protein